MTGFLCFSFQARGIMLTGILEWTGAIINTVLFCHDQSKCLPQKGLFVTLAKRPLSFGDLKSSSSFVTHIHLFLSSSVIYLQLPKEIKAGGGLHLLAVQVESQNKHRQDNRGHDL